MGVSEAGEVWSLFVEEDFEVLRGFLAAYREISE